MTNDGKASDVLTSHWGDICKFAKQTEAELEDKLSEFDSGYFGYKTGHNTMDKCGVSMENFSEIEGLLKKLSETIHKMINLPDANICNGNMVINKQIKRHKELFQSYSKEYENLKGASDERGYTPSKIYDMSSKSRSEECVIVISNGRRSDVIKRIDTRRVLGRKLLFFMSVGRRLSNLCVLVLMTISLLSLYIICK